MRLKRFKMPPFTPLGTLGFVAKTAPSQSQGGIFISALARGTEGPEGPETAPMDNRGTSVECGV